MEGGLIKLGSDVIMLGLRMAGLPRENPWIERGLRVCMNTDRLLRGEESDSNYISLTALSTIFGGLMVPLGVIDPMLLGGN